MARLDQVGEFSFIDSIARLVSRSRPQNSSVVIGIGDDAALNFYERCLTLLQVELPLLQEYFSIVICPTREEDAPWAREHFSVSDHVEPQCDGDLGRRLQESQRKITALGFERIVFIGSDAPSLPLDFLVDMTKMLDLFDAVLGPARDGGVWGIGASKPLPGLLGISWSTPNVYNELTEACHRADQSVGVLPGWYDVDQVDSLLLAADDLIRSPSIERQEFGTWIESLVIEANPRTE